MLTWPSHIDSFEHPYEKDFEVHRLFGAYIVEIFHKRVQVFLNSCNTLLLEDTETGSLAEFRENQRLVERGE